MKVPAVFTVIELVVAVVLHKNDAPVVPDAVKRELAQLSVTETDGAEGIEFTANVAAFEFTLPAMFVHTARYCLLLSAVVVVNDNVLPVAPVMLFHDPPLFSCHCTIGAGLPLAPELKVIFSPEHFVCEVGWVVIEGATILPSTPTVTITFCVLIHPFAVNVNTYVTFTGNAVVFTNVSLILPFPLSAALLMPLTAARLQANVVPTVLLPGV